VPFWTGFYKLLSVHKPDCVAVGYPPIADEKPNDMAKLRQQEQASKKISHQKNDKIHISILSIEKTKK
jgi:hypothetical protein